MPIFRFSKVFGVGRGAKVFLDLQGGLTRGAPPVLECYEEQTDNLENARRLIRELEKKLKGRNREISELKKVLDVAKGRVDLEGSVARGAVSDAGRYEEQAEDLRVAQRRIKEQKRMLKSRDREIFQLKNELRATKERGENGHVVKKGRRLSVFRFSKVFGVGRGAKVFLDLQGGLTRGAPPVLECYEEQTDNLENARRLIRELEKKLKGRNREISRLKDELRAAKGRVDLEGSVARGAVSDAGRYEEQAEDLRSARRWTRVQEQTLKGKDREISELKDELRATKERGESYRDGRAASRCMETGALPDFVIIGAGKCGTTSLYDLLTRHPHVERAALKEPHYFDYNFEKGMEWYRSQFPPPKWRDGRRSITGEATPYLSHPPVPERMAKAVPQARLIVLLRNPVDRVYSVYHREIRHVRETRRFEEAIEASPEYLTGSIYVDQLRRWSEFFDDEQMLVLKSEDFFGPQSDTLKLVLGFLGLPDWEPEEIPKVRNKGRYEQEMDPATRQRLEGYFEPHNRRLYEHLGVDLRW